MLSTIDAKEIDSFLLIARAVHAHELYEKIIQRRAIGRLS